jgi:hypothetical protein
MAALVASDISMEAITSKGSEVQSLITKKSCVPALVRSLEETPLGSKDEGIKLANAEIVFKAIESISDAKDIGKRSYFIRPCPFFLMHP